MGYWLCDIVLIFENLCVIIVGGIGFYFMVLIEGLVEILLMLDDV